VIEIEIMVAGKRVPVKLVKTNTKTIVVEFPDGRQIVRHKDKHLPPRIINPYAG
jgi:hypothetical protein